MVPVPVFYPEVTHILGKQVYRRVQDVPGWSPKRAEACRASTTGHVSRSHLLLFFAHHTAKGDLVCWRLPGMPCIRYLHARCSTLGLGDISCALTTAGEMDILDVFRKPSDIPPHLDDIMAKKPLPKVVWLQSGITNPEAEESLAKAGIRVVSNRCLKVDHQQAIMQSKM